MQLKEMIILSPEMMAENFAVVELLGNVENGTLHTFEEECCPAQEVRTEILRTLERLEEGKEETPDFAKEGLDLEKLKARLRPFMVPTQSIYDKEDFCTRNWKKVEEMGSPLREACAPELAWKLYLLLLLYIQACPKREIEEQIVSEAKAYFGMGAEIRGQGRKLYLFRGRLLCAEGAAVFLWENGWEKFYEADRPIRSMAFSGTYGLLVCFEDGSMPQETHREVKKLAQDAKVKDVSCYEDQAALLTREGELRTSLWLSEEGRRFLEGCRPVLWMTAGLNGISGIAGSSGRAFWTAGGGEMTDFTGVKMTDIRVVGEEARWAVLKKDGALHLDTGRQIENVRAVCLSQNGYVYIARKGEKERLFLCGFGGEEKELFAFPEGFAVRELRAGDGGVACRGMQEGADALYFQKDMEEAAGLRRIPAPGKKTAAAGNRRA